MVLMKLDRVATLAGQAWSPGRDVDVAPRVRGGSVMVSHRDGVEGFSAVPPMARCRQRRARDLDDGPVVSYTEGAGWSRCWWDARRWA